VWKAVGVVLLLCGAAITALTPDSALGQAAYLTSFAGLVVAAWTAALRSTGRGRTAWILVSSAVTSWLMGDVTWGILQLTHSESEVGLQDLFWLAGYPLLGAAMLGIVRRRRTGRGRAAFQDGLTLSTAAAVAAWQFFIAPGLDGGTDNVAAVLVGSLYPVGDVLLLASVLYLVLSPGRTGLPGTLLVAGTGLMLFMDTGISLLTSNWAAGDVDRLNGALLVANGLCVAPLLLRDRDRLIQPVRAEVAGLHPARLIFLGLAMLTAPITAVVQGAASVPERVGLLVATVTTVGLCLARFTGAVREQARAQQSLIHLAGHDVLTGLANRRALGSILSENLGGALLYLDLDGFKAINDEHGHAAGDAVLVEVARRIRGQVRSGDLCARLGGDEFAVLCPGLGPRGAAELAERLECALSEPIVAAGTVVRVGASVGTALAEDAADGDDLLSRADHAMFAIKRSRRSAEQAA
jgi:diguanylate cyclase (GGDEF)-like protein